MRVHLTTVLGLSAAKESSDVKKIQVGCSSSLQSAGKQSESTDQRAEGHSDERCVP
jgi:hypothetical protein